MSKSAERFLLYLPSAAPTSPKKAFRLKGIASWHRISHALDSARFCRLSAGSNLIGLLVLKWAAARHAVLDIVLKLGLDEDEDVFTTRHPSGYGHSLRWLH